MKRTKRTIDYKGRTFTTMKDLFNELSPEGLTLPTFRQRLYRELGKGVEPTEEAIDKALYKSLTRVMKPIRYKGVEYPSIQGLFKSIADKDNSLDYPAFIERINRQCFYLRAEPIDLSDEIIEEALTKPKRDKRG